MENQNQSPIEQQPQPTPPPKPVQEQSPYTALPAKSTWTDTDAQTLLAVNNLQTSKKAKGSKRFLIAMAVVVVMMIAAGLYASAHKSQNSSANSGSNISLPNPTNNPLNNGGSINQQVKYCSNVINASTVC